MRDTCEEVRMDFAFHEYSNLMFSYLFRVTIMPRDIQLAMRIRGDCRFGK